MVLALSCGANSIVSIPAGAGSRTISATVGQTIEVTLGNTGPGDYQSPPMISSTAVAYIGVEVIPPFTPAGPTQRFRFKAVSSGVAVLQFRRTLNELTLAVVDDTVRVR